MIRKLLFACSFTLIFAAIAGAQVRVVTNADLEKYKEQRLKAEKDLNENYAKLGFASPEVRAKRNDESAKALFAMSEKLKAESIARQQAQAEFEKRLAEQARYDAVIRALSTPQVPQQDNSVFWYNGFYQSGWNRPWRPQLQFGTGWRATGGGLIYEPGGKSSWIWNPPLVTPPVRPHRP